MYGEPVNTSKMEIPVPWPEYNWEERFCPNYLSDHPPTTDDYAGYLDIDVKRFHFCLQMPKPLVTLIGGEATARVFREAVAEAHEAWEQSFILACKKLNLIYNRALMDEISPGGSKYETVSDERRREITKNLAMAVRDILEHGQPKKLEEAKSHGQSKKSSG